MNMYKITIKNNTFLCQSDESILSAARKHVVNLSYGCANGGCGMCKIRVETGNYKLRTYSKDALKDEERQEGYILACKTIPLSDLRLILEEN